MSTQPSNVSVLPIVKYPQNNEDTLVVHRLTPDRVCIQTETNIVGPRQLQAHVIATGYILFIDEKKNELNKIQILHDVSGLTFKQLSKIIGVTVRMMHHWLDGTRPITLGYIEIIDELIRQLARLQQWPIFRRRDFLEKEVIKKIKFLNEIQNGKFDSLSNIIDPQLAIVRPLGLPVSGDFLSKRLPEDSISLMTSSTSSSGDHFTGKSKIARISRVRKKTK